MEKAKCKNDLLIEHLAAEGNRKGPVSDALSDAARALRGGKPVAGATADFLVQARKSLRRENQGDVSSGADRGGAGEQAKAFDELKKEPPHGGYKFANAVVLLRGEFANWVAKKFGPHLLAIYRTALK